MSKPITAFVARSFAASDGVRIAPILAFIETFENIGFFTKTAEPAEAEQVSEKIQSLIKECQVFIGFFTRKYPIVPKGLEGVQAVAFGKFNKWVAPSWVLQESGFALAMNKKMILFIEEGVEVPTLQGDVEYIVFDNRSPEMALKRATEMITKIAKDLLAIEIVADIRQSQETVPPPEEKQPAADTAEAEQPGILPFVRKLFKAISAGDADGMAEAYEQGLEYTRREKPQNELIWKVLYNRELAEAGRAEGVDALKTLSNEHREDNSPLTALAHVSQRFGNHQEAVDLLLRACTYVNAQVASLKLRAAEIYMEIKKYSDARALLLQAVETAEGKTRYEVLKRLYDCFREQALKSHALGIAELSLSENGAQPDLHFKVAYETDEYVELSIQHYLLVLSQTPTDVAAINNLGWAYERAELNIHSVNLYREAIQQGSDIAAGNLGFRFLQAGFVDEADRVLTEFEKAGKHHSRVTACRADISVREDSERSKLAVLRLTGDRERMFFKELGTNILARKDLKPSGKWKFPWCELEISVTDEGKLTGIGQRTEKAGGFGAFFGTASETNFKYSLTGDLTDGFCRFSVFITKDRGTGTLADYSHQSGLLVFTSDTDGILLDNVDDQKTRTVSYLRAVIDTPRQTIGQS
jgi:hypothetical protein